MHAIRKFAKNMHGEVMALKCPKIYVNDVVKLEEKKKGKGESTLVVHTTYKEISSLK